MFIKLTQLDGKPIWFNQAYIVTVEPRRKGTGALVVPLGDGLDYEVLESTDAIIEALGGAVKPAATPNVSSSASKNSSESDKISKSADPLETPDFRIEGGLIVPTPSPATKLQTVAKKKKATAVTVTKATKTTTRKTATKGTAKTTATKKKKKPALPPLPLTEEQLMRLQKMSPGSLRKLVNTLMSQFAVAETSPVVDALCAHEIISITDQGHVDWNWRQVE